jgi:hypothetical protein
MIGVMGTPGLCRGARGRPRHRHALLMNLVETTGLIPGGLDLQPSGGGIGDSDGVPGFSGFQPAL